MSVSAGHKGAEKPFLPAARVAVALTRAAFRVLSLLPQQKKVVFMSRQGARPLDFRLLEPDLRLVFPEHEIVWACVPKGGRLGLVVFAKQLWHAATAQLCIVDGYVPAVSLCSGLHRAACVQLWHALGALKKFGRQSLDTPAGHVREIAEVLRIHEGYDCVVAGLPGAAGALSQAFGCELGKMAVLGLPRVDYLLERRERVECGDAYSLNLPPVLRRTLESRNQGKFAVLYAPTFRKGAPRGSFRLDDAVRGLRAALPDPEVALLVARHPLQTQRSDTLRSDSTVFLDGVPAIDALCCVDAVVTDYSAIAFEAWLAGKRVYFYVPDIDEYRRSPGLNADPLAEFPDVSFKHAADLAAAVAACAKLCGKCGVGEAEPTSFDVFMEAYAGDLEPGVTRRMADYMGELVKARAASAGYAQAKGDCPEEGESCAVVGI